MMSLFFLSLQIDVKSSSVSKASIKWRKAEEESAEESGDIFRRLEEINIFSWKMTSLSPNFVVVGFFKLTLTFFLASFSTSSSDSMVCKSFAAFKRASSIDAASIFKDSDISRPEKSEISFKRIN